MADPRRDKTRRAMIGRRCALVAGADASIRQLLRTVLEIGGFQIVEATSQEDLCGLLRRADKAPDLIVLDVLLPTFSALNALSFVRSDPRLTDTPVVVLSSFADPPEQARFVRHGASTVMTKPFSAQRLLNLVSQMVGAPT